MAALQKTSDSQLCKCIYPEVRALTGKDMGPCGGNKWIDVLKILEFSDPVNIVRPEVVFPLKSWCCTLTWSWCSCSLHVFLLLPSVTVPITWVRSHHNLTEAVLGLQGKEREYTPKKAVGGSQKLLVGARRWYREREILKGLDEERLKGEVLCVCFNMLAVVVERTKPPPYPQRRPLPNL